MNRLHRVFWVASAAFFVAGTASAQQSGTLTNHAFAIGKGAGVTGYTSLLCGSAQLAVGQAAADPICKPLTGEVTMDATGATTISRAISPTWTGSHTFSNTVGITPPTGLSQGFNVVQNLAGTTGGNNVANFFQVNSDTASYGNFGIGAAMLYNFGGPTAAGGRIGYWANVRLTAPTSPSTTLRNYLGVSAGVEATTSDGGTALTLDNAKGAFFGIGPQCNANAGATNLLECTAGEADTFMELGSSAFIVYGWSIASLNKVQGAGYDAALAITAQTGHIGYKDGVLFTDSNGEFPFNSASTVIGGIFKGTQNVSNLIDFSQFSCSNLAWQSHNAQLDCNGRWASNGYATKAGTGGAFGGNYFNINWVGSQAHLFIDNSDQGVISLTSDYRLKHDVRPLQMTALDKVSAIETVNYRWRDVGIYKDDHVDHIGFIADQLKAVVPDAVSGEKDAKNPDGSDAYQTINILPVIAVLTKAVQELKADNEELRRLVRK
jgi:hypothetical protein